MDMYALRRAHQQLRRAMRLEQLHGLVVETNSAFRDAAVEASRQHDSLLAQLLLRHIDSSHCSSRHCSGVGKGTRADMSQTPSHLDSVQIRIGLLAAHPVVLAGLKHMLGDANLIVTHEAST